VSGKKAREERREQRVREESEAEGQARRQRMIQLGSAAAFLAIVAVAVLIVIGQSGDEGGDASNIEKVGAVKRELAGIPQDGLVLGDPSAKVKLVEFGDLQCPACKAFSEEIAPGLIDSKVRSGDARLEFRSFTIIDEDSAPAAAAAVAAGKQGRGWDFVELFYRNQGTEGTGYATDEFLTEVARAAGVPDIAKWNEDRKSRSVRKQVSAESAEAERLGIGSTPSFAIEGPATEGLETVGQMGTIGSAGELEAAIDAAG
jgi:protein-disulfide isomerase